jgi:cyclophilin family peptidyl-prolyl cis-trans isomerase
MNTYKLGWLAAASSAWLLLGCGGGGGYGGDTSPSVSSASAGTPKYSQPLLITVNGTNLDQGLGASSAGCSTITLSNTAPNISGASTAYLNCVVAGVGAQTLTVTRRSDGAALGSVAFTVPVPQVTLAMSNGAGVNGNLVLTLEAAKAPVTVSNFLNYVNSGFYAGTVIHRNAPGFVLQGGGYAGPLVANNSQPTEKRTNAAIVLEDNAGLSNLRFTVAMARTEAFDSATSQFFINLADNLFLDRTTGARGYAVFGTVSAGTDVVAAMAAAPCSLWPAFFPPVRPGVPSTDCLPTPNITITGAVQTR